jgi:hypothetical protein
MPTTVISKYGWHSASAPLPTEIEGEWIMYNLGASRRETLDSHLD